MAVATPALRQRVKVSCATHQTVFNQRKEIAMPYDDMTDQEYQEYYQLYKTPPISIRERAERFLLLGERGWGNTRAADDCFEDGNGDAVLMLVLRAVKACPNLKGSLQDWGYWSDDWQEKLEKLDEASFKLIVAEFKWQRIAIQLLYRPRWSVNTDISHLEIQVIGPDNMALPITETGYRSHFFPSKEIFTEAELIAHVEGWLNEEAQAPKWKKLQQKQLTLF